VGSAVQIWLFSRWFDQSISYKYEVYINLQNAITHHNDNACLDGIAAIVGQFNQSPQSIPHSSRMRQVLHFNPKFHRSTTSARHVAALLFSWWWFIARWIFKLIRFTSNGKPTTNNGSFSSSISLLFSSWYDTRLFALVLLICKGCYFSQAKSSWIPTTVLSSTFQSNMSRYAWSPYDSKTLIEP